MLFRYIATQTRQALALVSRKTCRTLWVILAFSLFVGLLELCVAGMVSLLGVALASPKSVLALGQVKYFLSLSPWLHDILQNPIFLLILVLGIVSLGVCLKNMLLFLLTYQQNRYAYEISTQVGTALFRSYMAKSYLWHLEQNDAQLYTIIGYRTYIGLLFTNILSLLTQFSIAFFLLTGGLCIAPLPTLTVLGITGIAAAAIYKFSRKRMKNYNQRIAAAQLEAGKNIMAALQGFRDMRIYKREAAVIEKVKVAFEKITIDYAFISTLPSLPSWVLESVGICTLLITVVAMAFLGFSLPSITGVLSLLAAMAWRLLPCMNKAVSAIVSLQGFKPYLDLFFKSLSDLENRLSPPAPLPFKESIRLKDISFSYPRGASPSLKNISLTIPKGAKLGIIGVSGAGKSTLIGILTGLLLPASGSIAIDDSVLSPTDTLGARVLMGYVPQAPYLLDGTLAENVALSRWGETIDEARVLEVCRMAAIDFWEQLPDAIHTEIGERGVRLSGGQAQRIAIARALYSNPELLIFDEATSALDDATENAIQQTIASLHEDATVVIIAHRLSTVEDCDTLIWLESGAIVACGKPRHILPLYKQKMSQSANSALAQF